jgi:hypothetical protein
MKGLDRLSPGCRVQDEASSAAPVFNLDTEFVVKIAAVPEQVDHDPGSLPVPEMIGSADHLLHLQLLHLLGTRPTLREAAGCVAAASSPPGVGPAGLSEGHRATMKA